MCVTVLRSWYFHEICHLLVAPTEKVRGEVVWGSTEPQMLAQPAGIPMMQIRTTKLMGSRS